MKKKKKNDMLQRYDYQSIPILFGEFSVDVSMLLYAKDYLLLRSSFSVQQYTLK